MKKVTILGILLLVMSCIPDSRNLNTYEEYCFDEPVKIKDIEKGSKEWFENNLSLKFEYQYEFLNVVAVPSLLEEEETGLPMEIMIAQSILESGWGKSTLAKTHYNFFGIKEFRKDRKGIQISTTEYRKGKRRKEKAKFRSYDNPQDGFSDRSEWFQSNYRYEDLDFDKLDWIEFAYELSERGYATDPEYLSKLIRVVKQYKIDQYSNWARTHTI